MSETPVTDPLDDAIARLGKHWGLMLSYGVLTLLLGVLILVWPGATLTVLAVMIAIQLLFTGMLDVIMAIASGEQSGGRRALLGLLGALSVTVGVMVLRHPLQTVEVIVMLVGALWIVGGVLRLIGAFVAGGPRGWSILSALLSVLAGIVVLVWPGITVVALVWVVAIWMILMGTVVIIGAFGVRAAGSDTTPVVVEA